MNDPDIAVPKCSAEDYSAQNFDIDRWVNPEMNAARGQPHLARRRLPFNAEDYAIARPA